MILLGVVVFVLAGTFTYAGGTWLIRRLTQKSKIEK